MAINKDGKLHTTLINHCTAASTRPPKYPAIKPRLVPKSSVITTDIRPTNREILEKMGDAFQAPSDPRSFRAKLAAIQALESMNREEAIPILKKVAETELDGRLVRSAKMAIRKIEKGKDKGEAIQKLDKRLDDFAEENKKLKDRLDRLEIQESKE